MSNPTPTTEPKVSKRGLYKPRLSRSNGEPLSLVKTEEKAKRKTAALPDTENTKIVEKVDLEEKAVEAKQKGGYKPRAARRKKLVLPDPSPFERVEAVRAEALKRQLAVEAINLKEEQERATIDLTQDSMEEGELSSSPIKKVFTTDMCF